MEVKEDSTGRLKQRYRRLTYLQVEWEVLAHPDIASSLCNCAPPPPRHQLPLSLPDTSPQADTIAAYPATPDRPSPSTLTNSCAARRYWTTSGSKSRASATEVELLMFSRVFRKSNFVRRVIPAHVENVHLRPTKSHMKSVVRNPSVQGNCCKHKTTSLWEYARKSKCSIVICSGHKYSNLACKHEHFFKHFQNGFLKSTNYRYWYFQDRHGQPVLSKTYAFSKRRWSTSNIHKLLRNIYLKTYLVHSASSLRAKFHYRFRSNFFSFHVLCCSLKNRSKGIKETVTNKYCILHAESKVLIQFTYLRLMQVFFARLLQKLSNSTFGPNLHLY